MPKTAKKRTAKAEPVKEAPTCLTETPQENSYSIMMFDEIEGTDCEQIPVSRAEYLAIKKLLIKLRGYTVPGVAA